MFRTFHTAALILVAIVLASTQARATITNYSTSFPDLAGWSTFGSPAAASTDPLDGRSVFVNSAPTGAATAFIQRTLATPAEIGPYTTLQSTLRRTSSSYVLAYQLFNSAGITHNAGDVQNVTLFLNSNASHIQLNVTTYTNNFDDTVNPALVALNVAYPGGDFPVTGSVADYTKFTLFMPSTGAWTYSDTFHGNIPIVPLGAEVGSLNTLDAQIWSLGGAGAQTGFLVDDLTLTVPEPASIGALVSAGVLLLGRRAKRTGSRA